MFKKIVDFFKGDGKAGENPPQGSELKPEDEKSVNLEQPADEIIEISGSELDNEAMAAIPEEPAGGEKETESKSKPNETSLSNTSVIVEASEAGTSDPGFQEKSSQKSWFARLKERLSKTKNSFVRKLGELFGDRMNINEETLERLEEILIEADIGVKTTQKIIGIMQEKLDTIKIKNMDELLILLQEIITSLVIQKDSALNVNCRPMSVMLVVGVNGVGKTTTIGKIAANLVKDGKKTMIVAGDTFRAGAIEQAEIWARRVGIPIVKAQPNSDPAAVVYDAIKAGKARGTEVLIIDTAGRLHTKYNLMEELKKIKRVIEREIPGAPHEVLQVLDGTTGQNAMMQAKTFNNAMGITGVALTKLDGTAKGGIVISIADELKIPIKLIGIGEAIEDLKEFNGADFVKAIFEQ